MFKNTVYVAIMLIESQCVCRFFFVIVNNDSMARFSALTVTALTTKASYFEIQYTGKNPVCPNNIRDV